MVNSQDLLGQYAEMLRYSRQMLELARQAEWDRLVDLERERAVIAEILLTQDKNSEWSQTDLEKKADLIGLILETDDETKCLTQAWMGELREILGSIGTEKKLSNAYQSP